MAEDENRTNNQNNPSESVGVDSSGNFPEPVGERKPDVDDANDEEFSSE